MRHIETEVIINAAPEKVWSRLMDFKQYSTWNPFIKSIKGQAFVDKHIQVEVQTLSGRSMKFEPIVLKNIRNDEFRWQGKLGVKGIFDGEHYFAVEEIGKGQTRFLHGEFFSGFLVGIMGGILRDTKKSFEEMNKALKLKCESE